MTYSQSEIDGMWRNWFMDDANRVESPMMRFFSILPHDPRCKLCSTPFEGAGGLMARSVFGRRRSTLNPNFCNMCEDYAQNHTGGGEVEMSILFADIRGSTALSEQMGVAAFRALINRFYVQATNAIVEEDGLVEKLSGDAVAAFWGAGFAGKNYAARSITAAKAIIRVMEKQEIPVGIGVHAGVAYFGSMGTEQGLVNISAIGEEVNTAARIASKAAAGEILVSKRALQWAKAPAADLELRSLELKGISEPVQVRVLHA